MSVHEKNSICCFSLDVMVARVKSDVDRMDALLCEAESTVEGAGAITGVTAGAASLRAFMPTIALFVRFYILLF